MPSLTWSLLALAANGTALPPSVMDSAAIDNITVEAAKLPAKTTDLCARVTLFDSERMRRELAQDIADLVRYEPGVDVVDQGSRFGLSGISIRDFVEIDSLKQAEIVRGPSSATFGSDALGGGVSFVTRGPLDLIDEDGRYFDLSAENRHTVTPHGWTHEQDNTKTVRNGHDTSGTLVREFGFNDYRAIEGFDLEPARDYRAKTTDYRARVRAAWQRRFAATGTLRLTTEIDGMPIIIATFEQAEKADETSPAEQLEAIETVPDEWTESESLLSSR